MAVAVRHRAPALQALVAPGGERRQQLGAQRRRHVLGRGLAGQCERAAELCEMLLAAVALRQMRLQTSAVVRVQRALEVVGDALDELLAGHLGQLVVAGAHVRCSSSAARTRERARCSSTRWLASLMSSVAQTSSASHPTMSRNMMTMR